MIKSISAILALAFILFQLNSARAVNQVPQTAPASPPPLRIAVYVAVREPFEPRQIQDFSNLCREAINQGVEIRPWLLLSEADGYWFKKWNVQKARAGVDRFLTMMNTQGMQTQWLTVDLEPTPRFLNELKNLMDSRQFIRAIRYLKRSSREKSLREAQKIYTDMIEQLHQNCISVHAVFNPLVLHDLGDGRRRVQSALGLPLEGVPWDEVSFMAYLAEFRRAWENVGPGIVYRYARKAALYYGSRATMDLGEVGSMVEPS